MDRRSFVETCATGAACLTGSLSAKHIADVAGDSIGLFFPVITDQLIDGLDTQ